MAKMQIPLNGSNYISEKRQQSFKDALADDHQVKPESDFQLTVSSENPQGKSLQTPVATSQAVETPNSGSFPDRSQKTESDSLDLALNHTYRHQQRTLEIHQQYISQQAEYIQLITAVLDQQGKAIKQQDGQTASSMIETFQRTLDNFHSLREQGVEIHREFLKQQTAFSERYLGAIENGHQPDLTPTRHRSSSKDQVTEWVVQQPPIVLDDQPDLQESAPGKAISATAPLKNEVDIGPDASGPTLDKLTSALLGIVSEKTGYPAEMLELDMDLEADLGIDSIKRVEILGSLEEQFPALPPADTEILSQTRTLQEIINYMGSAAPLPAAPDIESAASEPIKSIETQPGPPELEARENSSSAVDLTQVLLEIVAEKTGYPAEMLELEMDMEADLGIDSIKRVEILGSMEEKVPGLPAVPAETLAELRTLGQIVDLMGSNHRSSSPDKVDPSEEKKKVDPLNIDNTPVGLSPLPRPDYLEYTIPEGRSILLTSDGSSFTTSVSSILKEQGWEVVVWEFPDLLIGNDQHLVTEQDRHIKQSAAGIDAIESTLEALGSEYGRPAGFIHLHPTPDQSALFSSREEGTIKEVFFLAGALRDDLNHTQPGARNFFLNITRTNGSLGLSSTNGFSEGAGLSGLVKTLRWEWPEVFCRSIDFSAALSEDEMCQLLIEELHDPSRGLTEIGLSPNHRVTIKRDHKSI